jgi:ribose-phosphate pyrophosphokinase
LSLAAQECEKVRQLSIAPLLGETIRRVHEEESVSSMMASFVSPKNPV